MTVSPLANSDQQRSPHEQENCSTIIAPGSPQKRRSVRHSATSPNTWPSSSFFPDDGRIELDGNAVERAIRPIVLNRKNALFAGHDAGAENWAVIASLIGTCNLNGVDPHAWLAATLDAIVADHKQSLINGMLPWNFAAKV